MSIYKNRTDYIQQVFATETPALKSARESLSDENDRISIHPEVGKLLQLVIRMSGVKKIVEIGTLGGYSALWMSGALPVDGHIYTLEKEQRRADIARKNLAGVANVTVIEGDALQSLPALESKGPFDMAFIDADKINYLNYLDWAEKNVRTGGLIIGDNTFLFDAVWQDEQQDRVRETARQAMRTFNNRLADPARYCGILLPTYEGLTIAQKLF